MRKLTERQWDIVLDEVEDLATSARECMEMETKYEIEYEAWHEVLLMLTKEYEDDYAQSLHDCIR